MLTYNLINDKIIYFRIRRAYSEHQCQQGYAPTIHTLMEAIDKFYDKLQKDDWNAKFREMEETNYRKIRTR